MSTTPSAPLDRAAATAIVAGTVATLVTMAFHPTGGDIVRDAPGGGQAALARGVHLLAIVALPFLLAGLAALTWRLRAHAEAVLALASWTIAIVAIAAAAAMSGFVAPSLATALAQAGDDAVLRDALTTALGYTGRLNQAFATVYVVLAGVAVLAWSLAMRGQAMHDNAAHAPATWPRGLVVLGLVIGGAQVVIGATGILSLDVHGFGALVAGQATWLLWTAARLRRPA